MTDTSTAPAKKPAAAKKKVPAKKAAVGRAKFSDDAKITLLVKENPRRKGTVAYDKFAKFKLTAVRIVGVASVTEDVR